MCPCPCPVPAPPGTNRIADLSELEKLGESDIRQPLDINLLGNPISRKPRYRAGLLFSFPTLQVIDSRSVSDEERERALALSPDA